MTVEIKQRIDTINRDEVPRGYKSLLGSVVAEDFKETTFGKLFDFYGGLGIARDGLGKQGVPYLHYGDMHRNTFTKVSHGQYMNMPKYDGNLKGDETYLLKDGDVVFLDASEDIEGTARCVMVNNPENKPFVSGLHTFVAKEKNKILNKEYKQYITSSDYVKKQFMKLSSGFKVYGMNRNSIKGIVLAYPTSSKEQSKIAEILMKWDEAVQMQEKLIEKLETQKKALMQKLLTPKEGWKEIKVGDIFNVTRGQVLATNNCDGSYEYPVYSSQTSNNGLMGYYYDYLFENAITWTTDGANAGVVRFREGKFYCTNVCGVLISSDGYANLCVAYILDGVTRNYVSYVGNPKLMNNTMAGISIKLPSLPEQKHISKIIKVANENIELKRQILLKLKEQQKSLMQLLLTGIVRV